MNWFTVGVVSLCCFIALMAASVIAYFYFNTLPDWRFYASLAGLLILTFVFWALGIEEYERFNNLVE